MNYLKGSKWRNTYHNFTHLQVSYKLGAQHQPAGWGLPKVNGEIQKTPLCSIPPSYVVWTRPGREGELPCPHRVLLRCCVLFPLCILRMPLVLSWAPNLPELSLQQLPHDTALRMGLCRAWYPEELWLHQQLCRNPQVRFYSLYDTQWSFWSELHHYNIHSLGLSTTHRIRVVPSYERL